MAEGLKDSKPTAPIFIPRRPRELDHKLHLNASARGLRCVSISGFSGLIHLIHIHVLIEMVLFISYPNVLVGYSYILLTK